MNKVQFDNPMTYKQVVEHILRARKETNKPSLALLFYVEHKQPRTSRCGEVYLSVYEYTKGKPELENPRWLGDRFYKCDTYYKVLDV